ncbi:MAG: ROK family protein [Ruminiclostridium sp.]|nr:ROK family protein [Ruminiclostridium sp.]
MDSNVQNETYGAMPRTIRNFNRKIVLKAARERDTFSVADIASDIMLSRQSVMKALNYFLEKGIMIPMGKGNSTETGGKKPELYALRPPHKYVVILHRTDALVFNLMDMFRNTLDTLSITITKSLTSEEFVEALRTGSEKLLARNPEAKKVLYGVALAMGGLVEQKNHSLHRSMYFSNIQVGLPLYDILRKIYPNVPKIVVENVGRMAGRTVLFDYPKTNQNSRVFSLYIDRAIVGCFFVDGQLQDDSAMMMIEVGHMVLDVHDTEPCTCGSYGCAENLISIKKVRKRISEQIESYQNSCLAEIPVKDITFEKLFNGSKRGDALCAGEVQRLARLMGHLIRNIFLVCDPGTVVFQGNFSNADDLFDSMLRQSIQNDFVYTIRGGTFEIVYDKRDLITLESLGCAQSMIQAFYEDDNLYCSDSELLPVT